MFVFLFLLWSKLLKSNSVKERGPCKFVCDRSKHSTYLRDHESAYECNATRLCFCFCYVIICISINPFLGLNQTEPKRKKNKVVIVS